MAYDPVAIWKEGQRRRRKAAKLRAQGKTLQEIGDILGISKQRAGQILPGVKRGNGRP